MTLLLNKSDHLQSFTRRHIPHPVPTIVHGAKIQCENDENLHPTLDEDRIKLLQQVIGGTLCFEIILESPTLHTCNEIAKQKTKSTMKMLNSHGY